MSLLAVSISVNSILYAVLIVGGVGLFIGIALGIAGKFLSVEVDEKEVAIREALPGNNCGGCGYPGCQGFADACVKSESLEGMMCPVGGTVVMSKVASHLSLTGAPRVQASLYLLDTLSRLNIVISKR